MANLLYWKWNEFEVVSWTSQPADLAGIYPVGYHLCECHPQPGHTATTGRGPRFQTQAKATSVLPIEQIVKYSQKENIHQYPYWAKKLDRQPCISPCANNPTENKGNLAKKVHHTHRISPQPSHAWQKYFWQGGVINCLVSLKCIL